MVIRRSIYLLFISLVAVLVNAQTVTAPLLLKESETKIILDILKDLKNGEGSLSNLKISNAYLSTFVESADYGPMWYGDTIEVNQSGYLIQYQYKKEVPKWESSESIFIPSNKSAIFKKYTCHFGDSPKNHGHGYANRRVEWDSRLADILSILNKKRR